MTSTMRPIRRGLFADRLTDVADITARVMEADACFIYLYDRKKDDLVLSATNGVQEGAIGNVRIPLGERYEGWVGRRLEPLMLKDYHADSRFRETPGLDAGRLSVPVLPAPLRLFERGTGRGHGSVLPEGEGIFRRRDQFFHDADSASCRPRSRTNRCRPNCGR